MASSARARAICDHMASASHATIELDYAEDYETSLVRHQTAARTTTKFTHVVLFKMADSFDARVLQQAKSELSNLLKIPGVIDASFGETFTTQRSNGWTHCLVVLFNDVDKLSGYGPHAMHQAWATKFVVPHKIDIMGVDYV